jgi:HEAT repeat protein
LTHSTRITVGSFLVASLAACCITTARAEEPTPRDVLNKAKAEAGAIPKQAEALARLAWPVERASDPLVQAAARLELVGFGSYALPALRKTLKEVDPLYSADVTAALIEARRNEPSGSPPDYLPGLEEAIWFGSIEARRLAMLEISRYPFPPAVLTTIDAVHLNPELTLAGIRALGRLRDERGRFFLRRVLVHGEPRYQNLAAQALGLIGETGIPLLRELATSEQRGAREAAMAALLPYATPDDLTLLHEYVALHGEDDPALVESARSKALELETLLEERQLSDSASGESAP